MKALKVRKGVGQEVKLYLMNKDWLDSSRKIGKTVRYLFFPLKASANFKFLAKKFDGQIDNRNLPKFEQKGPRRLKDAVGRAVPEELVDKVRRSFDLVGDIAVVDIPRDLQKYEKVIAFALRRTHPQVKVVAKRVNKVGGRYRVRKIKVLDGENRSSTIHKEAGCRFKVDLNRVYFSPRLGKERLRIASKVRGAEKVLVMFSGVAPFGIVIAKKNPRSEVWNIELNPAAHKMAQENVKLNKLEKRVHLVRGDVSKFKSRRKFDRIVMVLPFDNEKFLKYALKVAKKGTNIHMYNILNEKDVSSARKRLREKYPLRINSVLKAGAYSPGVWRYVFEMKVL